MTVRENQRVWARWQIDVERILKGEAPIFAEREYYTDEMLKDLVAYFEEFVWEKKVAPKTGFKEWGIIRLWRSLKIK